MVLEMEIVEQRWHILVEMVADLRKRRVDIRPDVMRTIGICRTLINHYKIHGESPQPCCKNTCIDILNRIQLELANTETLLCIEAARTVGETYAERWRDKIISLWETRAKPFVKVVAVGEGNESSDQQIKPVNYSKS